MKGLALTIGVSNYNDPSDRLPNPINDALDFSKTLESLGFHSKAILDVTQQELDKAIIEFGSKLNDYDIGLFYFAGHGMQVDGENFLTTIDTNFGDETSAKFSSINLGKVLAYMDKSSNDTSIVVLDACRNNPFESRWSRSLSMRGLAPMYAPKGTLIAYATSPGQVASDGKGRNGLYTSAMLKHIFDENISIENFFKRVRNSVFTFSNGKQTPWEHTSLTGQFVFNSGTMLHASGSEYSTHALADKDYECSNVDSEIADIIDDLKVSNWYTQNPSISSARNLDIEIQDKNDLFVLGRNILQCASGSANNAIDYLNDLEYLKSAYDSKKMKHLVNGIFFEVYFDSNGLFRRHSLKNYLIELLTPIFENPLFENSLKFIQSQVHQFKEAIFYMPGISKESINLDLKIEKIDSRIGPVIKILDISYEGKSVLKLADPIENEDDLDIIYNSYEYVDIKRKLSHWTNTPLDMLSITFNIDCSPSDNSRIKFPHGFIVMK